MKISGSKRTVARALSLSAIGLTLSATAVFAQPQWHSKVLAQKQVKALPSGPLYWEVQNFTSPAAAKSAAQPTSLEVQVGGSAWLFTLAPKGTTISGGSKFAEIGPVEAVKAPAYRLRVAIAGGPPGAKMPAHKTPATDAFYVLTGQVTAGATKADAGKSLAAGASGAVSSSGKQDLDAFVLSVSATKAQMAAAKTK
ncbi:MAG TPA: hypothetical protein VFN42_08445 [Acetobacteraceae bacterium]|nr:hypothetical protein [Acetobacteraceae bacterium]